MIDSEIDQFRNSPWQTHPNNPRRTIPRRNQKHISKNGRYDDRHSNNTRYYPPATFHDRNETIDCQLRYNHDNVNVSKKHLHRNVTEYDFNFSSQTDYRKRTKPRPREDRQRKKVKFVLATKKSETAEDVRSSGDEDKTYIPVGYKYLKELGEKEEHEVVVEILTKNSRFDVFLDQSEVKPDWLFMVVKILANVCTSDFFGSKNEMLNKICRSRLMHSISFYLGEIQLETNSKTITNFKPFIIDLTAFLESVVSILPKMAYEKDFKRIIRKTMNALEEANAKFNSCVEETIFQKLNTLVEKIDNYQDMVEGKVFKLSLIHI